MICGIIFAHCLWRHLVFLYTLRIRNANSLENGFQRFLTVHLEFI